MQSPVTSDPGGGYTLHIRGGLGAHDKIEALSACCPVALAGSLWALESQAVGAGSGEQEGSWPGIGRGRPGDMQLEPESE
jgi:hypothetical protein